MSEKTYEKQRKTTTQSPSKSDSEPAEKNNTKNHTFDYAQEHFFGRREAGTLLRPKKKKKRKVDERGRKTKKKNRKRARRGEHLKIKKRKVDERGRKTGKKSKKS